MTVRTSRRMILQGAALAALAGPLAACSTTSGSSASSTQASAASGEITFSYLWSGPESDALQTIVRNFNSSQSNIKVTGVSSPDFQKQLTAMSASKGSFDVSDNFGNGVGSWASKGILAQLDDLYAKAGGNLSSFVPSTLGQMKYQGKIYSLPIASHTFQLLYNKKLLADAGVKPPTTITEFADAIKKLTKLTPSGDIQVLGLGNPDMGTTLTTLGYCFGGSWDDSNGPTPDQPQNVAAVQWWQDNIISAYGADKYAKFKAGWGQYMSAQDPFYTGQVAMVIDGEWQAVNIPKVAPNLQWGVTAIPVPDPSLAGTTQVTTSTLFIPQNSQNKEAAAAFLKYMTGSEAMGAFTKALGNLPTRTDLLSSNTYADIPNFSMWLDSLKSDKVKALSSAPFASQYVQDLASAFDSVAGGKSTAADALAKVATAAKSYAG